MATSPLVTAIIIFYNGERFLDEAVASVFRQSYPAWELLLVDDGSSDSSTQLARRLAQQHPERVRYLEHAGHANRGMSATRNRGLKEARGRYVAFLDADDVWLPEKLEEQVAILEREPEAALVYGQSQYWYSWTGRPDDRRRDFVENVGVPVGSHVEPPLLLTYCLLGENVSPPPPSDFMVRREVAEQVGGFEEGFQGAYQMFEDQAFMTKVFLQKTVYVAEACWDRYRIHPDSWCARMTEAGQFDTVRLFYLRWVEAYLARQEAVAPDVWRALRRALWPYRHPRLHRYLVDRPRYLAGRLTRTMRRAGQKLSGIQA